jgi:hypothetical protein
MSGKRAKALRKQVYGDMSPKVREYQWFKVDVFRKGQVSKVPARTSYRVENTGLRREYQSLKRVVI